jgi:hypothetical protein
MTLHWTAQASASGGERSINSWLPTQGRVLPSFFSGQRFIFQNEARFFQTIFYFFGK